jgi:hypothetical protein
MSEFTSIVHVNSLVWITSLGPGEEGVTNRIHDDLIPYLSLENIAFRPSEPKTAAEFLQTLNSIAVAAADGMKPILHLDTHGSK